MMKKYDFTAISPPQTNWEVGSIVEIEPSQPNAPVIRATPITANAPIKIYPSNVPEMSEKHKDNMDLSLGVSLPVKLKAKLAVKGGRKYSVVATGNIIKRIYLDPYAVDTFPVIKTKYSHKWGTALKAGKLNYLYELWFVDSLEYKFYDENDVELDLSVPVKIPLEFSPKFSWGNEGALVYKGSTPICVGYRKRPIIQNKEGIIPLAPASGATVRGMEAKIDLYK